MQTIIFQASNMGKIIARMIGIKLRLNSRTLCQKGFFGKLPIPPCWRTPLAWNLCNCWCWCCYLQFDVDSNAKHDLVVCHLQEWTPSFFSANTGSEHFRTTSPKESLHWDFMKYFSSCLREWTKILPIDKHMEFSQDIDISNSISSYLMRERYIYSEGNVSRYFTG